MTIQQIKYVITIYETGQFSKAGEKLYVTQPSLSKAVRDLEDELGITIFERMNKGIIVTDAGEEFITYAREVYRQYETLYQKFRDPGSIKHKFGVSCQHYSFASKAFAETVGMLEKNGENTDNKFDLAFRETRTSEVIHDVSTLRSEIGIIFTADFNTKYIEKLLKDNDLVFTELLRCPVYVFLCRSNPLADKAVIRSEDLTGYPCVIYEQGSCEPYYLSEELVPINDYDRIIKVTDKLTMFNLIADMNGFTFSTGMNYNTLNGREYLCVPFVSSDNDAQPEIRIGFIVRKDHILSDIGEIYINNLRQIINESSECQHIQNKSIYENYTFRNVYLTSYVRDREYEYITVYLNTEYIDYQTDDNTGNIIRGDKTTMWKMRYLMKFMRSENRQTDQPKFCPNCGAPLDITSSGKCGYCGSTVTTSSFDWLLSDFTTVRADTKDDGIRV